MIYRTLHTYILRELMRVFLLTASTLTTLLAFGGMFKPLTKQGVDISQVMVLMLNLMPAMLAYAIPIAALFAAVLVYWRMSTDNELTACRAGGVSFLTIVLPAFLLGMAVASMDLVFVNYVVPRFLQSTERAVRSDLGSWIVSQVGRQEKFQYEALPLAVTADSAEEVDSGDPNVSKVVLHGMAASFLDSRGKPTAMAVAQEATVMIRNLPEQDSAEVSFTLKNGSGFDPYNGFRKVTGSVDSILWSRPFPSYFKSKAKFLNWRDLIKLDQNPALFPPVADVVDKIEVAHRYTEIANNVQQWWAKNSSAERGVTFEQSVPTADKAEVTLFASLSQIDTAAAPEECLTFSGRSPGSVTVVIRQGGVPVTTYRCDKADLVMSFDRFGGASLGAQLRLRGKVTGENHAMKIQTTESDSFPVPALVIPDALTHTRVYADDARHELIDFAKQSANKNVNNLARLAQLNIDRLFQNITSELNSRASFALSCLTLVMLGAALGILLHGKNPLAVFVVGFVPAIILVLLITAGRQLTEGGKQNTIAGVTMIWAGNGLLLAMVAGVYFKLLRR